MKIDKRNQLGLLFHDMNKDKIYNSLDKSKYEDDTQQLALKYLLTDKDNIDYYFTTTAFELAKKYNIDKFEPSDFSLVDKKKIYKITFLVNDKLFYRFFIGPNYIKVLSCSEIEGNFNFSTSFIIPEINEINWGGLTKDGNLTWRDIEEAKLFIKLLLFFEYTETIIHEVEPNKHYNKTLTDRYTNKTDSNIKIVDTTWNKMIYVNGKFSVSGHWRLQRYGEGLTKRRSIWISEYEKDGYTRRAGKELNAV